MSKRVRVMPKHLAVKEANAIVSAAIHGAIHGGAGSQYNEESFERITEALITIMNRFDERKATMEQVEPYLA